jgi:hypothetical protein
VDEQAQQRLGGLTELYNVAEDAKTQHMLLQQAIAYATKANLANLLGPVIKVRKEDFPQGPYLRVNQGPQQGFHAFISCIAHHSTLKACHHKERESCEQIPLAHHSILQSQ